jgi:hypothetical protein
VDQRLYLPESWTSDRECCRHAGVPEEVDFATKPEVVRRMLGPPWWTGSRSDGPAWTRTTRDQVHQLGAELFAHVLVMFGRFGVVADDEPVGVGYPHLLDAQVLADVLIAALSG